MLDIEKLIYKVIADSLVDYAKRTHCGMVDMFRQEEPEGIDLAYIIDGESYRVSVRKEV